jgi:hypothetical protein
MHRNSVPPVAYVQPSDQVVAPPDNWKTVQDARGRFFINMPSDDIKPIEVDIKGLPPAYGYSSGHFSIVVSEHNGVTPARDMSKSWSNMKKGALSTRSGRYDGGTYYEVTAPLDMTTNRDTRVFTTAKYLYDIELLGPSDANFDQQFQEFANSFRVTPAG